MVGILGGVGPMATVYFMEMLLSKTDAKRDQDHLDMLVSNHATIPDRTAYILGQSGESPLDVMIEDAKMLEREGCQFLVLPCNTAHYFFEKIQQAISIPLLNIIRETVSFCMEQIDSVKTVGIMATEGTIQSNTYKMECERQGISCIVPDFSLQQTITSIIYDQVKAGKPVERELFCSMLDQMREMGCDAVILGCTELSVAFRDLAVSVEYPDVVDSLTVLAERTILFAGKKLRQEA